MTLHFLVFVAQCIIPFLIHSLSLGEKAWIRVGPETRRWKEGECLLYDTTYEHETMNEHPSQERVVLHVDFFNTLALTPTEIEVMQYIYSLREEFMKAEGGYKYTCSSTVEVGLDSSWSLFPFVFNKKVSQKLVNRFCRKRSQETSS